MTVLILQFPASPPILNVWHQQPLSNLRLSLFEEEFKTREGVPCGVCSMKKSTIRVQNFSFSFVDKVSYHCVRVSIVSVWNSLPSFPSIFISSEKGDRGNCANCPREVIDCAPKYWSLSTVIFDGTLRDILRRVIRIFLLMLFF